MPRQARAEFAGIHRGLVSLAGGGHPVEELSTIRRNIEIGLPCGSDRFIKKLEKQIGRILEYRPPGRAVKQEDD